MANLNMDRNCHIDRIGCHIDTLTVRSLNVHETSSYEGDIRLTWNLVYILSLGWLI